ncbi:MAG: hypothetical protein AB7M12_09630 [Hyphomonadaceae bacterium]
MRGQALLAAGALAMMTALAAAPAAQAQSYAPPGAYAAPYQGPVESCLNRKKSNAILGGVLGAAAGAMLGNNIAGSGHRGDGSVLGGVLGAGAGAAIGGSGARCVDYASPPAPQAVVPPAPSAQGYGYGYGDDGLAGGPDDRSYGYRDEGGYRAEGPPPRAYAYGGPRDCRWGEAVSRDRWGRPYRENVYMCRDRYGEWVIQR